MSVAARANAQPGIYAYGRHRPRIHRAAFVTAGTHVVGRVTIGRGASVWFGAVLRGDFGRIVVGEESLVEDNAVLHGRVRVGRRCVVGHGAILHGCTVRDGAVIGANAVVFDGAVVGEDALVAVGSIVYPRTKVPPRTVFRNSPSGNHPVVEPVGRRLWRWRARTYRHIVTVYRDGAAGRPARRAGRRR